MYALTERFCKLLMNDDRVPHAVRADLRKRLDELRHWRTALCHGAWFGFFGDRAGVLSHYYRKGKRADILDRQPKEAAPPAPRLRM